MAACVQNPSQEEFQKTGCNEVSGQCANQKARKEFTTSHLQIQPNLPNRPKPISLKVQSCGGHSWDLELSDLTSVKELLGMVAKRSGLPAGTQILYMNNQILQEGKILGDYTRKSKMTLMVVHKVYGG